MGHPAYGAKGPSLLGLGLGLELLITILLVLRIYVRYTISLHGGWALAWFAITWVATVITQGFFIPACLHGHGNHIEVVEKEGELGQMLKLTWLAYFFFDVSLPLGKIAVSSFLITVFGPAFRVQRRLIAFVAISNAVLAIPNFFLLWFQCSPPSAMWHPAEKEKCNVMPNLYYSIALAIWAGLSDLTQAILPIAAIWPLRLSNKMKLGLSLLMGLGAFTSCCAFARAYYLHTLEAPDLSYALYKMSIWGILEYTLVLVASSVPPIYPLFKKYFLKPGPGEPMCSTITELRNHRERQKCRPSPPDAISITTGTLQVGSGQTRSFAESLLQQESYAEKGMLPPPPIAVAQQTTKPEGLGVSVINAGKIPSHGTWLQMDDTEK